MSQIFARSEPDCHFSAAPSSNVVSHPLFAGKDRVHYNAAPLDSCIVTGLRSYLRFAFP